MTMDDYDYRDCFLAALSGLAANPKTLAESESNGRMARQLRELGNYADVIARHAVGFLKSDE
jgi:hypothetical protein